MIKLLVLSLIATIPLYAQHPVIALSPEDAKQVQNLYAEKDALSKKLEALENTIKLKYLTTTDDDGGNCYSGAAININGNTYYGDTINNEASKKAGHIKKGWSCGLFIYSDDYKYIMPAYSVPESPSSPRNSYPCFFGSLQTSSGCSSPPSYSTPASCMVENEKYTYTEGQK